MSDQFDAMSVIELRQLAKEMGVKLGAGINKQGIIEKLREASNQEQDAPEVPEESVQSPPAASSSRPIRSAAIITDDEETDEEEEDIPILTPNPILRSAPHTVSMRGTTPPPTGAAAPSGSSLSTISAKAPAFNMGGSRSWNNPRTYQAQGSTYRAQSPNNWGARPAQTGDDQRTYRNPAPQQQADARPPQPAYVNRFGPYQGVGEPEPRPAQEYRNYTAPAQQQNYAPPRDSAPANQGYASPIASRREKLGPMSIAEILAAGECGDGEGILEVHPDGYGFLRTNHYLPGKQDIYISNAQIRRFNLRTGDYVAGKTRLQRDADRFSAMLYITEVNGASPEEMPTRVRFEELTPIFPKKRITLTGKKETDATLRLIDLLCPIGFGQRALMLCSPKVDRLALLNKLAAAISKNYGKAEMMMVLVDEKPEEVTALKESVKGEVIYSTFDEPAENQVRVVEMALERAMRMVEQKKDVIILGDSLTRLARACNTIAPLTARTLGGGLAAGSLNKPKRFFGAARNTREGGSLTVIVTALSDTGSEMDEAILREFTGNSNMTCAWKQASRKQTEPVLQGRECGTIHDEWLLNDEEKQLADQIRAYLAAQPAETGWNSLLSLLEENETDEALSAALAEGKTQD